MEWFGTRYYKLLYRNRSEEEAQAFLDRLLSYLKLKPGSRILDLGCGRGRHSKYLATKGFDVTGLDLDTKNIASASEFESGNLKFMQHDMRNPFPGGGYDAVLNLFTSFGYFESETEDILTLNNVSNALNVNGVFVLDFLNAKKVINELIPKSRFNCDGVEFNINKCIENNFIVKKIEVLDNGVIHHFKEQVKLLNKKIFEEYFERSGLIVKDILGDYHLTWYDENSSDRLLFITTKKKNLK